jgi:hypothetical protein
MSIDAQFTVVEACAFCGAAPLPTVALAVLSYDLHDADVVALTTCALLVPETASVVALNCSTWLGGDPVTDHPVLGAASDQLTPVPAGN